MSKPRESRLRRAISLVRPTGGAVAFILVLSLGVAAMNAVEPLVLKLLFDGIETGEGRATLIRALVYLVGLILVREAIVALSNWMTWRTRLRLHFRLLEGTVDRLHELPVDFHQREGVGATMTRLDRGIQGFLEAFNQAAFQALPAAVYLVMSLYFMFDLEPRLALVVLIFAPIPPLISRFSAPVQTRRQKRLLDRWADIYSRFNEVLSGIATVKSFTREESEKRRFLDAVDDANRDVARGVGFDSGISAAQNLIIGGARLAALAVGAGLALGGEITLGTLVAFLGYVAGLFGPVQGLAGIYQTLHQASVSLDTIVDILDAEASVADHPEARRATRVEGEIAFESVSFGYPNRPLLLEGIDLRVPAGERVAIVGPSGGGKTTMMALLQRFYDPTSGRVLVDGHDIRELTQRSLRENIGVVAQDALLFNDTIHHNIAYGRPDAAEWEVSEAARHASAHDMILRLPDGYQTRVGERGGRLSAGERQRIAIARALLKNPPILILDEATAALDAETESLVQAAVDHLCQNRTTFIIAHRLSTVVSADRIVVLRDGGIAEQGDHAELMRAGRYYASLVDKQIGGLIDTA